MYSRKFHALLACAAFIAGALLFATLTEKSVDTWRVAFWSILGVGVYIGLSGLFGFDPHRTRIARFASPLLHYVDRWELRLGQATLSMLGCVVVLAKVIDPTHFVTAVVCGTLSAWTYFAIRLYNGGYGKERKVRVAERS
jgi:hypothetical protein